MNYLEKISLENTIDLRSIVDNYKQPAIICRSNDKMPNLLSIVSANQKFCHTFKASAKSIINKSYDFFYDNLDFDDFPEDRIEYSRLLNSIQDRKECEASLHLPNYNRYYKNKIHIHYLPSIVYDNIVFDNYHLFLYTKTLVSNTDVKSHSKENLQILRNLERTLRTEKLLREISNLIIIDLPIQKLAQKLALILLNHLKCDRCIIYDYEYGKQNFFVESYLSDIKTIYQRGNHQKTIQIIKKFVDFQHNFYQKFGLKDSKKSFVFAIQNVWEDANFSTLVDFFEEYQVSAEIVVNIIFNGVVVGCICVHQTLQRNWLNEEIEFLEIVAEQFSIALDRFYSTKKIIVSNIYLLDTKNKLENSLNHEKEMRKIQNEFIALVSHEFKTPLQVIDSARELIVRKLNSNENTKQFITNYCNKIRSGIQRMNSLISSTLNLAKIENNKGQIKLEIVEFDLQKMMLEIIDKNINFAQQKNINISYSISKLPCHYQSDPKLIDHIIGNIIVNAIKYSQANSEIKILTKVLANSILISIIDHGIGIPQSDLKNVGNKFFRASNAISVSGTGIGVYITKYFINLLDGKISIKSQEGVGTRVAIFLKKHHH